jgi:hypothetical protein
MVDDNEWSRARVLKYDSGLVYYRGANAAAFVWLQLRLYNADPSDPKVPIFAAGSGFE